MAERQVAEMNRVAQASRNSRRRGAGSVSHSGMDAPKKAPTQNTCEEAGLEISKAEARRLRQRASRVAASQRKLAEAEAQATQKFLRETALGFQERNTPLETTEPDKKPKEPKIKPAKEQAEPNKIAEDLLVGLWEAKLKHAEDM